MRVVLLVLACILTVACAPTPTAADVQRDRQELVVAEGIQEVGVPSIKNFREMKLAKDIYEMRDQTGLTTYTYLWNEFNGKLVFLCNSIGYPLPYATQFTAPEAMQTYNLAARSSGGDGTERLPQPEINGLFSPSSAEGTWVLCKDPNGPDTRPVYTEPRVIVSQHPLETKP